MNIKKTVEKIPGMMLAPLFSWAVLHTFWPGTGKYFGSFTNGMITGVVPILPSGCSVWAPPLKSVQPGPFSKSLAHW